MSAAEPIHPPNADTVALRGPDADVAGADVAGADVAGADVAGDGVAVAYLHALYDASPDGFMLFRAVRARVGATGATGNPAAAAPIVDFEWRYANPAAGALVGRASHALVGRRLLDEMPGNRVDGLFDAYVGVVTSGTAWQREFTYQHEGLDATFRTVAVRVDDGFGVTFIDISTATRAQATLRATAARLRLLADAGRALGSVADRIAACTVIANLLVPRVADACAIDLADPDGTPVRVAHAATDPTLDAALPPAGAPAAAATLERVELLTEAQRARRDAENANRAKSQFLATMSHELRTPLNAILGYTDLLDAGIGGTLADPQLRYVNRVRASGPHLLGLIADALVRPQSRARQVHLDVDTPPAAVRYLGDEERVRQVLVNLLSNAIKFTPADGNVALQWRHVAAPDGGQDAPIAPSIGADRDDAASSTRRLAPPLPQRPTPEHGWLCIAVRDTGIGIPADALDRIFELFVQVDASRTRTAEGTGLGLALSRQFATRMLGDLTVASELGRGSVFAL